MKKYLNEDMLRIIISIILFLISLIVPTTFKLIILISIYYLFCLNAQIYKQFYQKSFLF